MSCFAFKVVLMTDVSFQFDTAFLLREPADEYHAQAGKYLSSHLLADFRRCPQLYHLKVTGRIVEEDRPAFLVGRALHTLVLEGEEQFEREFAVGGPINPRTGERYGSTTKAFAAWAAASGKAVLTDAQSELVTQMATAVRGHEAAQELLATGVAEGVVRAEYCGLPCQIRMDWFEPHLGIVDLKTCDNLDYFEADARRFGYIHQLAFYQAVLAQRIGLLVPVQLIAVEKKEPFRCGVWQILSESLAFARQDNEAAIERLRQCQANQHWPTGYEEPRLLDCI